MEGKSIVLFFFFVMVFDGNYYVIVVIGNKCVVGEIIVWGELCCFFFENVKIKKGELKFCIFVINKCNIYILEKENVCIKLCEC